MRKDVALFLFRQEEILSRLGVELSAGTWRPQGFKLLFLRDPKPRVIARAPFADRVVHTALVSLMEPCFMRSAMPESFACRVGKGAERAILHLREGMRKHRFALHLDIRAYFPSVDTEILEALVRRKVRDEAFMSVLHLVIESGRGLYDSEPARAWTGLGPDWPPQGRGLPMGALTSQFLATHLVLVELDHYLKRALKVPWCCRYVDDIYLFGDQRAELRRWRAQVGRWLWEERGLKLKHPQARVLSCAGHLDALGHRLTRYEEDPRWPCKGQRGCFSVRNVSVGVVCPEAPVGRKRSLLGLI